MSIQAHTQRIKACGIIAILRGGFSVDDILTIAEALITNGIDVLEVTFNSPAVLDALPRLQAEFGAQALIGAGTVRILDDFQRAVDAGAGFTVAPNFAADVAAYAQQNGYLHIPGVATPSDAVNAFNAGCVLQKLFPASALGGVDYLKAIRGPLDDIDFIAVGGIDIENMEDYVSAGAVAVGLGSSLVSGKTISVADIARQSRRARQIFDAQAKS